MEEEDAKGDDDWGWLSSVSTSVAIAAVELASVEAIPTAAALVADGSRTSPPRSCVYDCLPRTAFKPSSMPVLTRSLK